MKKLIFFVSLISQLSFAAPAFDYPNEHSGLFQLGAGYSATLMCSCLFVMKLSEVACDKFSGPDPNLAWDSVDYENKRVSTWFLWKKQTAHFIDKKSGCRIN